MKQIILIRGPLGVGKSTVAKAVAAALGGVYFSIDATLSAHHLDENIPPESDGIPVERFLRVHEILKSEIDAALARGQVVVVDGNVYYRAQVDDLEQRYPGSMLCLTLTAPLEVCIARDAARALVFGIDAVRAIFNMVSAVEVGVPIDATGSEDETVQNVLNAVRE